MSTAKDVAHRFAQALDVGDWAGAESLLTPNCRYSCRGSEIQGPQRIIGSYRKIDDWVRATFDSVRYESHVHEDSPVSAMINFRDRIERGEHSLDFRCRQRITLDGGGCIAEIEHIDLPGEPEKAARFNAACGVEKPA